MSKILVTGATGQFGKAAIDFLLEKSVLAGDISALVRDEAKAEDLKNKGVVLKKGDYDDYSGLIDAFTGIDKLLFVSGNDVQNRESQHENVVKATSEAGVKHIIYTSFARQNDSDDSPIGFVAKSHIETEKQIKASGLSYTILKNVLYVDMLPIFWGEKVLETGIFLPAGEGKAAYATRSDMAEAAANILAGSGHYDKEYILANTTNYSLQDAADILSELSDKTVEYISPSTEVYKETLTKAGVPAVYIGMFAGFSEAIKQGEFATDKSDLETLLGRKPASLKEYLLSIYGTHK